MLIPKPIANGFLAESPTASPVPDRKVLLFERLRRPKVNRLVTCRIFPEPPPSEDYLGLGYGKQHPVNDQTLEEKLSGTAYSTVFSNRAQIATRRAEGWEVFFDEDGKHRDYGGQILMIRGRLRP